MPQRSHEIETNGLHNRRSLRVALLSLAMLYPSNALADDPAFDGQLMWGAFGASPVIEKAERCGLNAEALRVTQEVYRSMPRTDEERVALEARLLEIGELAGFGRDPTQSSVSREFLRTMLTSRVLMTLNYEAQGGREGMTCVERWLTDEGFRRVRADEADGIRASGLD